MRIAFVSHHFAKNGGQGRVNFEMVRHCAKQGIDATVFATTFADDLADHGVRWTPILPAMRIIDLVYVARFAQMADQALERVRHDFDLIVATGFVMRARHHVNVSHFVHDAWRRSPVHAGRIQKGLHRWYQTTYSNFNSKWERFAYNAADVVVAVSNSVRTELTGIGISAERIEVICNGVDLDEFHPGAANRAALGLPQDVPLGLFAGDIRTPRKNLDTVLKAMIALPSQHLAVAGCTRRSPYPAMAESLGLSGRVHFMGYRDDLPQIMRACDYFIFPSRYEACSLALLEAMASGLPVVTARTAGGSELVSDDCGYVLSDPDDVVALREVLRTLASDQCRRADLAQGARARAERHSWARMGDRYVRLFADMASSSSCRGDLSLAETGV